jgi:hypothetical protein
MVELMAIAKASPVTLRGKLPFVLSLREGEFTTPIARGRNAAVLGTLARALRAMDPQAQYEVVQADALGFDYCLTDHRLQPNLVIAETIGRTEGLLLHRELVRIDPANRVRYAVCHYGSLTLAERNQ